jgi:hypothetical protein
MTTTTSKLQPLTTSIVSKPPSEPKTIRQLRPVHNTNHRAHNINNLAINGTNINKKNLARNIARRNKNCA